MKFSSASEVHWLTIQSVFRNTYGHLHVVGSCNGLVLSETRQIYGNKLSLSLLNPITGQRLEIPNSALDEDFRFTSRSKAYGLGYDACSDDYKIVALALFHGETLVLVYSVKNALWKMAKSYPYILVNEYSSGSFVNGAIHWLVSDGSGGDAKEIAAFDVSNEVFRENRIPAGVLSCSLYAVGGFLMLIVDERDGYRNARVHVCILKEYGLPESWTKFTVLAGGFNVKPLCFTGEEKLVFIVGKHDLFLYNLSKGTRKKMVVNRVPASFCDGCSFEYSLDFPKPTLVSRV